MAQVVAIASFNADLTVRVAQPLARGETLMAGAFDIGPGGKGSNAAVACARQGAEVAVVARLGDDDFGRMALALWRGEGIDVSAVEIASGQRSGVAQILVYDDGDNSIAVAPGAGAGLGAAQVAAAHSLVTGARVLMAPNEVPLAARLAAFELAKRHGLMTLLNPAPAQELPDELIARCDLLTPNENELRALAGMAPDAPIESAARRLLARGAAAVLVTLGSAGCTLYRNGNDRADLHLRGHAVTVADTVGAGDTFTGALAAELARGQSLADAMAWANAAAAIAVTGRGAIGAMPGRDAVARLLGQDSRA